MKAQEFLQQLKKLDKMIENKLAEKEQWKSIATGTTAPANGERVQSSGNGQKLENAVIKFVDIEKEIDAYIDKLIAIKQDVISVIEQLNTREYDLLHKMYVQYYSMQEIVEMYDKSESWFRTIHRSGLKKVQNILDNREKQKSTEKYGKVLESAESC